jgi:hypothetical protein
MGGRRIILLPRGIYFGETNQSLGSKVGEFADSSSSNDLWRFSVVAKGGSSMKLWPGSKDIAEYDLIVVGSGAPGLTAAAVAAREGLNVAVLEKSSLFGGTSAISAGTIWVPDNPQMEQAGMRDDVDGARQYLTQQLGEFGNPDVIETLVKSGRKMLEFASGLDPTT